MKKFFVLLLILATIAAAMFFTCPTEDNHVDRVVKEIGRIARNNMEDDSGTSMLLGYIESAVVESNEEIAKTLIQNHFELDDYYLIGIGKLTYKHQEAPVTIGVFNRVFYLKRADPLLETIQEGTSPTNILRLFIDDDKD